MSATAILVSASPSATACSTTLSLISRTPSSPINCAKSWTVVKSGVPVGLGQPAQVPRWRVVPDLVLQLAVGPIPDRHQGQRTQQCPELGRPSSRVLELLFADLLGPDLHLGPQSTVSVRTTMGWLSGNWIAGRLERGKRSGLGRLRPLGRRGIADLLGHAVPSATSGPSLSIPYRASDRKRRPRSSSSRTVHHFREHGGYPPHQLPSPRPGWSKDTNPDAPGASWRHLPRERNRARSSGSALGRRHRGRWPRPG